VTIEIGVTDTTKQIGNSQALSGSDASLTPFFQHHKTNEAVKYSAVFEENDVNVFSVFYRTSVIKRPIELDVSAMPVHPPFHKGGCGVASSLHKVIEIVWDVTSAHESRENKMVALSKVNIGAFEAANRLDDKRGVPDNAHGFLYLQCFFIIYHFNYKLISF
tara:strand:- start:95 stop:580 length:486 start_codon:yes stop_codon:yes gene_type:complete